MPTQFAALDTGFPNLTGQESTEQKVDAMYNYTFMLLEYLRYILRNLGPENLNEAEMTDWIGKTVKAETVISNTVITNELYSEYGAIADLAVSELRTDYQKAARYLAGNTGSLDYLRIHDEEIDFLTGTVATEGGVPQTEQLHHGDRYFWWTDSGMTQMTSTEATAYPVMVYRYAELTKASFRFSQVTENGVTTKIPQLILGAGNGQTADPDRGKGFLRKNTGSFDLWLRTSTGAENGVFIGDEYTDITGLRKTTELDFSGWDGGCFSETVDGGGTGSYAVTFDSVGRPVKITDGAGHETAVVW